MDWRKLINHRCLMTFGVKPEVVYEFIPIEVSPGGRVRLASPFFGGGTSWHEPAAVSFLEDLGSTEKPALTALKN